MYVVLTEIHFRNTFSYYLQNVSGRIRDSSREWGFLNIEFYIVENIGNADQR